MTRFVYRFAAFATVQSILFSIFCIAQIEVIETHIRRARQFMSEGKAEAAMVEYEATVAIEPSNVEAQGNLGVLHFFANDCTKALPHLSAALTLDPSLARIQALVGICQRRQNRLEEAERNLSAALPLVVNPSIHNLVLRNLIEIETAREDLVVASANIAELIKIAPSDPEDLYLAYRIYTDLADSARNALTVAAPDSARMHLLTAERFIRAGNATMAIQQYQKALAKDPSLLGVHYELGEAILQESESEDSLNRATAELKLALNEDPRNAGAEAKLGFIAAIRGDSKLAESHYSRALFLNPDEFNALVGFAKILRARGENDKAANYLSQASKIDAMDDSLHYQLSQIFRHLGRTADAEREMQLFLTIRGLKAKSIPIDQQMTAH